MLEALEDERKLWKTSGSRGRQAGVVEDKRESWKSSEEVGKAQERAEGSRCNGTLQNPTHAIFGALEPAYYEIYRQRNHVRALQSYKAMSDMMVKNSLVKVKGSRLKAHPPYFGDMEGKVLLNSMAHASFNPKMVSIQFPLMASF